VGERSPVCVAAGRSDPIITAITEERARFAELIVAWPPSAEEVAEHVAAIDNIKTSRA
jgi:hypothetical protein